MEAPPPSLPTPDGTAVALRLATPDDAALLQTWDAAPHVVACHTDSPDDPAPDDDWDWPTELARSVDWRTIWIGEAEGRPVGVVVAIDAAREETHYWGPAAPGLQALDIWLGEAAEIGRGIGTAMMRLALARCFADPAVEAVLVDPLASNVRAHRFYERLGFRLVGPRRFGDDACLVYRLDRALWTP